MSPKNKIEMGSNRNFGIVFFIIFLAIALWPLLNQNEIRFWSLIISIIFLILGIINSKVLTPLNKIWFKFGILLGNIVSPIVLGFVYFVFVIPTGYIMRFLGKDILNLKKDSNIKTYWINKKEKNSNMKDQF